MSFNVIGAFKVKETLNVHAGVTVELYNMSIELIFRWILR